jgi:hypothetical protein
MTDPRETEPPERGNEDPHQDDDWEALLEHDDMSWGLVHWEDHDDRPT